MQLYISAERQNAYFVNTIKKYCDDSQGKHSWIYLPDMPSLPGETLSRRMMRYIATADLIFMDATPKKLQKRINERTEDEWVTNQGILIEYAMAVTLGKIDDIKVYCLESPNYLHQVLREKVVDPYPLNDENTFLKYIDQIANQRERDSLALLRQSRIRASFSSLYPEI
jgi:hypothetical protein